MKKSGLLLAALLVGLTSAMAAAPDMKDFNKQARYTKMINPEAKQLLPRNVITFSPRLSPSGKNVDSVWFTSNGLPGNSAPQGAMGTFATNCLPNDTINWEIWIEANYNGQLDTAGGSRDKLLFSFLAANGDTTGFYGDAPYDTTAAHDSMIVHAFKMSFSPALFWFKAKSIIDGSSTWDSLRVTPMISPWATVSGHVHVPGDSALQGSIYFMGWVDNYNDNGWTLVVTDQDGNYTVGFDGSIQDSVWQFDDFENPLQGSAVSYLPPARASILVSAGSHSGFDFSYQSATEFIEGQITQDPGDVQPVDYNQVWIVAQSQGGGNWYEGAPDGAGHYFMAVAADTYHVWASSDGNQFLFKPGQFDNVAVAPYDTIALDFLANYAHCRVEVALSGYPSATQNWMGASDDNFWNGYQTNLEVNNSGTYNLYICNSTGWHVWPPDVAGYNVSPSYYYLGDITHADTYRGIYTFTYTPTGVEGNPKDRLMPTVFKLSQNHPNPVRNIASISYQLPKPAKVSLTIYNILGQAVKSFDEGSKESGYYNIKWDGRDTRNNLLGNGIYFYRLQAGEYSATKKLVLMH